MKILINRKPVKGPWGGGNLFVDSFCKILSSYGHEVVHNLSDDLDAIFMQDPRYSDLGISINEIAQFKTKNPNVKVFHRVNECDARKGTTGVDELLRNSSKFTDHTFFVSNWMENYHLKKGWNCNSTSVLYNGVDLDHFKEREKINNGKVNIVTHHWSDNPYKGSDVYEFLNSWISSQSEFTFTYIGRYSGDLKNTSMISPLYGLDLGKELSKYDVYVSGSRFDPGPNHIIESIACNIPTIVHADGGGAVEFSGERNSFKDSEELVHLIVSIKNGLKMGHNLSPVDWKTCINQALRTIEAKIK